MAIETVRERLERLKKTPPSSWPPTIHYVEREPIITPEAVFMRKAEKIINNLESIRKKMLSDTGQYLSLFYELKKAENEFINLLQEKEVKFLDLPENFVRKLEEIKAKIRR